MEAKLSEEGLRAWQAFLHAHHAVVTRLDEDLRTNHGITFAEYDVLLRLARAPGRTLRMGDLAGRVLLSPSGVTRLVERLTAKGLISRQSDPRDRRAVLAELTAAGSSLIRASSRTHLRGIREHFALRLTPDELRDVASALERIAGPHMPH